MSFLPSGKKSCPKCRSRATKIVHLTMGMVECQVCGHEYPFAEESGETRTNEDARAAENPSASSC